MKTLRKLLDAELDLLFPPRCPYCQKLLEEAEAQGCPDCLSALPYTENGGLRRDTEAGAGFSFCVAPYYYEDSVRDSLLRFKFHRRPEYALRYAPALADCIREYISGDWDALTWAPVSRKRLRERGYDQAKLLARYTAKALGTKPLRTLDKFRNVPKQSSLGDAAERRTNVAGAYRVPKPELVQGKRLLLVDDIITTGSTLSECAGALLAAGAKEVVCAAFACTRRGEATVEEDAGFFTEENTWR